LENLPQPNEQLFFGAFIFLNLRMYEQPRIKLIMAEKREKEIKMSALGLLGFVLVT